MHTTVLLVRHAAPFLPVAGDPPEVDNGRSLTDGGRQAAMDLASRLQDMPIAAIYSSPYRRALETVQPLAKALDMEVQLRDDLAERWLGPRILSDDEWMAIYRRTWEEIDFAPFGGESRRVTEKRAFGALEDLRRRHAGHLVVASSHGGLIGSVLGALDEELRFDDVLQMPMPAVFVLQESGGTWRVAPFPHRSRPPVEFRSAHVHDASAIASVSLRSRQAARRGVYSNAYLDGLTMVGAKAAAVACLERDGWLTRVAELAGDVVAYATAGPWSEDTTGTIAEVDELYVAPDQFRRGIGSRTLADVEVELAAAGFESIVLWVRDDDAALEAFYSSQGFLRQEQTKVLEKDRPRAFRIWMKRLSRA